MCDFISWIETPRKIYFLTDDLIDKVVERGIDPIDIAGHEAIKRVFGLNKTRTKLLEKECTNFSNPGDLPEQIAKALKESRITRFGVAKELLTQTALAEYKKIKQTAWAEYKKIKQTAWAEYKKIKQPALAEYKKIKQTALAEYEKIKQTAWAEYEKVEQTAWAEYEKVEQTAWAEYEKVEQPAWAEYEKITQPAFWELFSNPENRVEAWR